MAGKFNHMYLDDRRSNKAAYMSFCLSFMYAIIMLQIRCWVIVANEDYPY